MKSLGSRYGYGSYVGSDGSVHVGIKKTPFVRYMKEVTFVGSRVDKEMRKKHQEDPTTTSNSADNMIVLEEDIEQARVTKPLRPVSTVGNVSLLSGVNRRNASIMRRM